MKRARDWDLDRPVKEEEAFQRGYAHGTARVERLQRIVREKEAQLNAIHLRHKSETRSLKQKLEAFKKAVSPEVWNGVMFGELGKREPRKSWYELRPGKGRPAP